LSILCRDIPTDIKINSEMMKKTILIFAVCILMENCGINKNKKEILEINVKDFKELNSGIFHELDCSFFSVNLTLLNKTPDTIRFWSMTCAWQLNWMTNSSHLELFNPGCDSNFPNIFTIPGESTFSYEGILRLDKNYLNKDNFRLAFIHIRESELKPHPHEEFLNILSFKKKNNKDIYWSGSFKL
jgi:hypothetical protein